MKTCLFCGTPYEDDQSCPLCHRSNESGELVGERVNGYRHRNLRTPHPRAHLIMSAIPAGMFFFLSLLLFMSRYRDVFFFFYLPNMRDGVAMGLLGMLISVAMLIYSVYRYRVMSQASLARIYIMNESFLTKNTDYMDVKSYHNFLKLTRSFLYLLFLIPIAILPFYLSFVYYADHYTSMYILDLFHVILPNVDRCNAFKFVMYVFPVISTVLLSSDILFSLYEFAMLKKEDEKAIALNRAFRDGEEMIDEVDEEEESYDAEEDFDPDTAENMENYADMVYAEIHDMTEAEPQSTEEDETPVAEPDKGDEMTAETSEAAPVEVSAPPVEAFKALKDMDERMMNLPQPMTVEPTLKMLREQLSASLTRHGVRMTEDRVNAIISTMSAFRIIVLCGHPTLIPKVYAAIAECFGMGKGAVDLPAIQNNELDLFFVNNEQTRTASPLLQALYRQQYRKEGVEVITCCGAGQAECTALTELFFDHAKKPTKSSTISLGETCIQNLPRKLTVEAHAPNEQKQISLEITANTWLMIAPRDGETLEAAYDALRQGVAANLCLHGEVFETDAHVEPLIADPISYSHFCTYAKSVSETHYLSEEQWKKVDKLEAFLHERISFVLDNRLMRKMETYANVFLALGSDVNHVIDCMVENLLVTLLSECDCEKLKSEDGRASLTELMERTFGADHIPLCCELLKRMGLDA